MRCSGGDTSIAMNGQLPPQPPLPRSSPDAAAVNDPLKRLHRGPLTLNRMDRFLLNFQMPPPE